MSSATSISWKIGSTIMGREEELEKKSHTEK